MLYYASFDLLTVLCQIQPLVAFKRILTLHDLEFVSDTEFSCVKIYLYLN